MKVIMQEGIPIKLWLEDIETGALEQAINLSKLPFAFKHIAIMPDSHRGYGMPIGGVLATKNVVIPQAVGVDIGCGMCAVKTSLTEMPIELLRKIFGGNKKYQGGIRSAIPVGRNHHSKRQDPNLLPTTFGQITYQEFGSALKQLGTLGSGNHFIEIQKGSDGCIWIMIHSGSRNLGFKVANHYNKVAKQINEKWYTSVPKNVDLAFLPMSSKEGEAYMREMNYCLEFAKANRYWMMNKVKEIIQEIAEKEKLDKVLFDDIIDVHHNYATIENHFGSNVVVHRKGATSARKGQYGIIPGSQGTKSYIVKGLGNPESFMSCSHGAGRLMSRTKAKQTLNLEEEVKKMNDKGILHSIRGINSLDEASSAYKDIDVVMENQKDLVEIVVELTPLGVIKG